MNILWPLAESMPEFKGLNLCTAEGLVLPLQDVRVGVPSLGWQTSYPLLRLVLVPSVRNSGLHAENHTVLSFWQSSGDTVWGYFFNLLLNRQLYCTVTDLCVCASSLPAFLPPLYERLFSLFPTHHPRLLQFYPVLPGLCF